MKIERQKDNQIVRQQVRKIDIFIVRWGDRFKDR